MPLNKLYSNLPEERIQAADIYSNEKQIQAIIGLKNHYWFGAPNAWLVFLGISPGGSPPKGKECISNYKSQISFSKASNHIESFNDSRGEKGFWGKIREYTNDIFPDLKDSEKYRTILAGNLIDEQTGDSKELIKNNYQKDNILNGAKASMEICEIVKPKLLICLQQEVYNILNAQLSYYGHSEYKSNDTLHVQSGLTNNIVYKVPVKYLVSENKLWNKWVLTRMPMHPSRSNFCNAKYFKEQFMLEVMKKTNNYLKD